MKRVLIFLTAFILSLGVNAQKVTALPAVTSSADASLIIVRSGASGDVLSQITVSNFFKDRTVTGTLAVTTAMNPDANDGATLGQSGTGWSDVYLASGAVIDFDAGDFTIAHTNSQYVTVTGDLGIAGRLDLSNGGTIETTGGNIDNTELYALNGVTGSLAYSTENYGATGAGDIVLSIGATLTTVNITDVIKLTPTASPPASATEGMIYADTDHHLYYYNGTTWVQLDN